MIEEIRRGEELRDSINYILKEKKENQALIIPFNMKYFLLNILDFKMLTILQKRTININFVETESMLIVDTEKLNAITLDNIGRVFLNKLEEYTFDQLIELTIKYNSEPITAANIPQFSQFHDGIHNILKVLRQAGDYGPTYNEVGKYLTERGKQDGAYKKYGENHSKLAALLDLTYLERNGTIQVYLTLLGKELEKLTVQQAEAIAAKLAIKIPVITEILKRAMVGRVAIVDVLKEYLSDTTARRRESNVRNIIKIIQEHYVGSEYTEVFKNII